jgi:hypothetical protein
MIIYQFKVFKDRFRRFFFDMTRLEMIGCVFSKSLIFSLMCKRISNYSDLYPIDHRIAAPAK